MSGKTFTMKKNALRAARKLLADNKAPSPNFEIISAAGGGFRILWDTPAAVEQAAEAIAAEAASVSAKRPRTFYQHRSDAAAAAKSMMRSGRAPTRRFVVEDGGRKWSIDWLPDDAPASAKGRLKTRDGTKQDLVIEMLKRPEGASDAEIKEATGWKIVRGFIAGTVKKKLGHTVLSTKEAERGRIYRVLA